MKQPPPPIVAGICMLSILSFGAATAKADDQGAISTHDVVWNSPGKNAADSMPIGNGELGINLWVEELIRNSFLRTHGGRGRISIAG